MFFSQLFFCPTTLSICTTAPITSCSTTNSDLPYLGVANNAPILIHTCVSMSRKVVWCLVTFSTVSSKGVTYVSYRFAEFVEFQVCPQKVTLLNAFGVSRETCCNSVLKQPLEADSKHCKHVKQTNSQFLQGKKHLNVVFFYKKSPSISFWH